MREWKTEQVKEGKNYKSIEGKNDRMKGWNKEKQLKKITIKRKWKQ